MQANSRVKLYKKLMIASLALFLTGFVTTLLVLLHMYASVNDCGFSSGICELSSTYELAAKIGGAATFIGFYASIVFVFLYFTKRRKA